jgi:hypothetical protein
MDYQLFSVVNVVPDQRNKPKRTVIWNDGRVQLSSHLGLMGLNRDSMHRWLQIGPVGGAWRCFPTGCRAAIESVRLGSPGEIRRQRQEAF